MMYDFHSHFLPGIDDGARDAKQSCDILRYLSSRGIKKVCATPHYSSHHESVERFLERREEAKQRLFDYMNTLGQDEIGQLPEIEYGSEVRLERGLSERHGVDRLAIGDTGYILLELPFSSYEEWMSEEIYNISYQFGLKPIMAHINRYYTLYKKSEFEDLFFSGNFVLQINCESMIGFSSKVRTKKIIKEYDCIVLGCDIHDPAKTGESGLDRMLSFTDKLSDERKRAFSHLEKKILS